MRNLLALLLFLPSLCLAQVPDYVPGEGLVAWYPFNGNANDESGNGNEGTVNGATPASDRQGILNQAFDFDGQDDFIDCGFDTSIDPDEITVSAWIQFDVWEHQAIIVSKRGASGWGPSYNFKLFSTTSENGFAADWSIQGNGRLTSNPADFESLVWHHVVYSHSQSTVALYHNGALMDSIASPGLLSPEVNVPLLIGKAVNGLGAFDGRIDDIGIWSRALNDEEIQALFLGSPPAYGCLDSAACNFDSVANTDNGSCQYGCLYCGVGTVWDPVNEECIVAIPTDTDFDGCVSAGDVLNLLATFGSCPPVPFADACGDQSALMYHGHEYDIVAVGDQCWFAENLRTDQFTDGTAIAEMVGDSLWWATEPAQSYFDQDTNLLAIRGRLYNGHAVMDERGLCPSGWHVPTDQEFMALETATGMPEDELDTTDGFRGCSASVGDGWKSSSGWLAQDGGTDLWGFSVVASGYYTTTDGFGNAFVNAELWSSTIDVEGKLWRRQVPADSGCLFRNSWDVHVGSAIRCIKD